jgi:hypothetical protein
MNKIHTLAHIRTARMLNSFRACVNMTGRSQIIADFGRVYLAECYRLNRVQHSQGKRILVRSRL